MTTPDMTDKNRTPAGVPTGGEFAASSKAESRVSLGGKPPRSFAVLAADSAEALNAALPGGRAVAYADEAVEYEDSQGNSFNVLLVDLARGQRVTVVPNDSDGYPVTAHRTTGVDGTLSTDDIVSATREAVSRAHKQRVYREEMDAFATSTNTERVWAVDDEHDYAFGALDSDDYVKFTTYGYRPADVREDRPGAGIDTLRLTLGTHPDAAEGNRDPDAQGFEASLVGGTVHYFSGNPTARLAPWQVKALEREIALRGAPDPGSVLESAARVGADRMRDDVEGSGAVGGR